MKIDLPVFDTNSLLSSTSLRKCSNCSAKIEVKKINIYLPCLQTSGIDIYFRVLLGMGWDAKTRNSLCSELQNTTL